MSLTAQRSRRRWSRIVGALAAVTLLALVAVGLTQALKSERGVDRPSRLTVAQMHTRLLGSPPPLAWLHDRAGQVLGGGQAALRAREGALRGYPIVINKWASWCGPCRAEFGAFQHAAVDFGRQVAFIGLDSGESRRADAEAFLRSFPVSYPSYYDASGRLGLQVTDSSFTPVTVFVATDGRRYIHQGPYANVQALERDVARYAR